MKRTGELARTVVSVTKRPLVIITLLAALIYGFATQLVFLGSDLQSVERQPLIWFLVLFPFAVFALLGWLVTCHHEKL